MSESLFHFFGEANKENNLRANFKHFKSLLELLKIINQTKSFLFFIAATKIAEHEREMRRTLAFNFFLLLPIIYSVDWQFIEQAPTRELIALRENECSNSIVYSLTKSIKY